MLLHRLVNIAGARPNLYLHGKECVRQASLAPIVRRQDGVQHLGPLLKAHLRTVSFSIYGYLPISNRKTNYRLWCGFTAAVL